MNIIVKLKIRPKLECWFLKSGGVFSWAEITAKIWWESEATLTPSLFLSYLGPNPNVNSFSPLNFPLDQ